MAMNIDLNMDVFFDSMILLNKERDIIRQEVLAGDLSRSDRLTFITDEITSFYKRMNPGTDPQEPASDDMDFQPVDRRRKRRISVESAPDPELRLHNKFQLLDSLTDQQVNENSVLSPEDHPPRLNDPTNATTVQRPRRVPPLIITQQVEWKPLSESLKHITTEEFTGKLNSENLKIQPRNPTDFRAISKFLTENKFNYHTYKLNEDKTLKVVLRGIPSNTPTTEIMDELTQLKFPVKNVSQLRGTRSKNPLPLFLIELEKTSDSKEIYNLKTLSYLRITVESFRRKKGPTQCHSCQRFGHVQSSCHNPSRCVKCAGTHHTRDCIKTLETPPKCINCSGTHTANYRLCPAYQKLIVTNTTQPIRDSRTRAGLSFRDALKAPTQPPPAPKHADSNCTDDRNITPPSANSSVLNDLLGLIPLIREIGFENVKELIKLLNVNPGCVGSLTGNLARNAASQPRRV